MAALSAGTSKTKPAEWGRATLTLRVVPPSSDAEKASIEARLLDALRGLLGETSIIVTGWMTVFEYVDESGRPRLAAFASDMPTWRLAGMNDTGYQMLVEEAEYEDED
jgi:hypothetical protein